MAKTYLALGSNLGDRMAHLRQAVADLPRPIRCSKVYETAPIDTPEGSGSFLNAVVEVDLEADPVPLIRLVRRLEATAKRERNRVNGPRTLDVDVIYVTGMASEDPEMIVPHPRCRGRAFVIVPLSDLDPELASELNPEIAQAASGARANGLREVYPGVKLFGESIC